MNILHLSPYVPETRTGHAGGVCMGKTVETLGKHHHVVVLTFCNDAREETLLKDHPDYHYIETSPTVYVWKVLSRLWMPNMFALRADRRFRRMLCRLIETEKIDAVHAEYTAMGQYAKLKRKYPGLRFNLVEHDVVTQSYERMVRQSTGLKKCYAKIELKKVKKAEARYLAETDQVFTLNDKDKDLLKTLYGIHNAEVIRPWYGIDATEFATPDTGEAKDIPQSFCFIGHMGREENHEAALRLVRIFNEIGNPDWTLNIIGAHPKPELQRLESDRVHITGFVEDINAEIRKNRFAVFPLSRGAGIKFKVLLACGLGLPVVTGTVGAEGIDPDFRVLIPAEADEDFRRQIETLMADPGLCCRKSAESLAFVRKRFNWAETETLFDRVYRDPEEGTK